MMLLLQMRHSDSCPHKLVGMCRKTGAATGDCCGCFQHSLTGDDDELMLVSLRTGNGETTATSWPRFFTLLL